MARAPPAYSPNLGIQQPPMQRMSRELRGGAESIRSERIPEASRDLKSHGWTDGKTESCSSIVKNEGCSDYTSSSLDPTPT
ncbi:hypothetical protein AAMO2058_000597400 [Amorphochlora amoebiformis]